MPILITINSELSTIDGPLRTYINFKKLDWARYASDECLAETGETRTVEQAVKTLWKAVNKACDLFIPAGRIQHFQPTLPASAKSLADERDRKRGLNPTDETLNDLNKQIQKLMVEDKRTKWHSAVDKCDHRTGISHLWRLVKGLSGKQSHNSPNKGVQFADMTYLDPKMIANKFTKLTPTPICLTGDMSKRQLKWQLHRLPLTGTPSFTPADTKEAIRLAKSSTAIGPDGMCTLHLKKLVQGAINYLINISNLSISTGQIPEIWHKAIIILILNPATDNNIGKNWRPFSLLCPAAKTLEELLLPKILTHIPFHPAQHGFRLKHSTCTTLSTITADIAAGSPNSAHCARSDYYIRPCGPSTTARLCLLHLLAGNNPSLALQLYAEQAN